MSAHLSRQLVAAELSSRVPRADQVLELGRQRVEHQDVLLAEQLLQARLVVGAGGSQQDGTPGSIA